MFRTVNGVAKTVIDSIPGEDGRKRFATGAVRSNDAEGVRYDLISPIGLRRLAETYAEGARKYGANNWRKGIPFSDLVNHAIRHVELFREGDASEDHLAHAAWGLFTLMHFVETGAGALDDRVFGTSPDRSGEGEEVAGPAVDMRLRPGCSPDHCDCAACRAFPSIAETARQLDEFRKFADDASKEAAARVFESEMFGPVVEFRKFADEAAAVAAMLPNCGCDDCNRARERKAEAGRVVGADVVKAAVARILRSPSGGRNSTLYDESYKIGRDIAAGKVSGSDALGRLMNAGRDLGLSWNESSKIVRDGLNEGEASFNGVDAPADVKADATDDDFAPVDQYGDLADHLRAVLSDLGGEILAVNRANGWNVTTPDDWRDNVNLDKIPSKLALIHSEVSEALEAFRKWDIDNFKEEMADVLIRVLDCTEGLGFDLAGPILAKLAKNRTRGYRHGGKRV